MGYKYNNILTSESHGNGELLKITEI